MKQIWEDTDFTLTGTYRPVRITVDGKEIYKGVLSAYPNEDEVNMLINKVCEPFLEIDYPENTGVTSHPEAYRVFTVEDWDGNLLGTQDFIYDWSYETFRPVLSKPVNGKLDCRMRLPYTMWRSEAGDVDVHIGTDPWVDPDYCGGDCSWDMCADCFEDYDYYDPYPDVYFEDTVYLNGLPKDYPITGSDGEQKYVWGIDSFIMDESGYTFSVYGSDIISGETNIDGSVLVLTIPYAQATSPNRYPPTGETAYVDFESASGMIKRHITAIVAYSLVRSGYSTESIYIEPVPFLSVDLDPENFNEYYIGKRTSYLENGIHSAGFETNGSMYEGPYDASRNIVQRQYVEFAQIHDVFHTEAAPYILSSITYSDEAVTVTMSSPFRLNCARILDYNSGKNYASSGAKPGNEISAIKKIRFLDQLDGLLISKDGRYYGTSDYEIDIPISDRKFKSFACGYNGSMGNSYLFNFQTALSYKDEKYNFAWPVLPDGEKTVVNTSNGVSIPWNSTPYHACHQYPETGVTDFYVTSFYTNQFIYEGGYAKIKQFNDVVKAANITYALDSQHLKAERVNAEEWLINDINEEDPTFVGDYGYLNVYNGETLAGHILYNNVGNNVSLYDCIQVEENYPSVRLLGPSAHEDMLGVTFTGYGEDNVVLRWNTLLSDGVVLYNYPQRLNLNRYLYKSTHSNNISITCNGISSFSGITVTLRGVYDGFLITNNGDYGVTDIYFSGVTLDEFTNIAGLPSVYYNPTSDMDTLHVRGKWIRGKFGQRITLHNTEYPGQTSVWVPDEII